MSKLARIVLIVTVIVAALAIVGIAYVKSTGLVARGNPGGLEARIARRVRSFAIPRAARERANPVNASDEGLADARAHYADHCASCHGQDGRGQTDVGRGLWPKAPDMRLPATQDLSDGELFWIIENGIRFTGMPGWSTGTAEGEQASWHLVHLIRHLPDLNDDEASEIGKMMPRSPAEVRQDINAERFLQGLDPLP